MSDVQAIDDAGPPAPVFLALVGSYALAATLLLMGLLGFIWMPLTTRSASGRRSSGFSSLQRHIWRGGEAVPDAR